MKVEPNVVNTILAALRYYQGQGQCEPANRDEWIHDIATNGGDDAPMDAEEVDELCENLNTGVLEIIPKELLVRAMDAVEYYHEHEGAPGLVAVMCKALGRTVPEDVAEEINAMEDP